MVLILPYVLAERGHLCRARLARDVESSHFYSGASAPIVDNAPHAFNYEVMLVFGNGHDLWIGPRRIERLERATGAVSRIAGFPDRVDLFHEVRNVKFASHAHSGHRTQQSDRRDDVVDLPK